MNNKIKAVLVKPGETATITEIDPELASMHMLVGGYIEAIYPFNDSVALVCNEEGKLKGLEENRALVDDYGRAYDIIVGTFFICGVRGSEFCSLTQEQAELYMAMFYHPQAFITIGDKVIAMTQEDN